MSLFVRYGEKRLDTTTEKVENLMVIACVRLTCLGTVAGEKRKFLARWVDFQNVLSAIMARE